MPAMTDPTDALISFQKVLRQGAIELQPGQLDRKLFVHMDNPKASVSRLTYVRLSGDTVTAMALFVSDGRMKGRPCFAVGYAVPDEFRGNGRAKEVVRAAISELESGFRRAQVLPIYLEAIVGAGNKASLSVATSTLSDAPVAITDEFSGEPAFQFVRLVV